MEREYVPFVLGDCTLVIIDCNKPHNLAKSKYNERRAETEEALGILKTKLDISCLADIKPEDFGRYAHFLGGKVRDRARHVVEECDRVKKAAKAMKNGDLVSLGGLLTESHGSLKELYEVTGKELDALVSAALGHPACLGSRMTGAGFGGCTVSIVKRDGVDDFKKYVSVRYENEIGYAPRIYDASVADGITVTKL